MKMAVFSDSHGNLQLLAQALNSAVMKGADILVHLGDFYDDLCSLDCRARTVYRVPGLPGVDTFSPSVESIAHFDFAGRSIVAIHNRAKLQLQKGEGLLILHGHTHKAGCALEDDGRWYLNPGHLKADVDRGEKASFAILTERAENEFTCDFFSPDGEALFSCSLAI